ncbi:Ger(x)C family spore germination protein [Mesobacillus harenae]|uniref:Ger(x)C family spore germination protein n=1 Tax=Mesobacillus harenae TaxID=2213203 RepID=UPI001580170C|nr:Ger(x)C family spore germination C-terminal domain-containing protein [Mesobacillus harenae]
MKKRWRKIKLLLVSVTLLLAGCWDQRELEERAYVIAIGLEKAGDKEEDKGQVKVTYLIANPEVGTQASGGASDEPPQETLTIPASDFINSRNIANVVIGKEISYDLLRTILVSEELARDQHFLRLIYNANKDREVKRSTQLIISKESASEYFKNNKPTLETRPHKFYELMLQRGIETGLIPNSEIRSFFRITEADASLFTAAYTSSEQKPDYENRDDEFIAGELPVSGEINKTQFIGSAVFKEGQMIGKLTGEETRLTGLLRLEQDVTDILTTLPDPGDGKYRISVRINKYKKNKVDMDLKSFPPKINVVVPMRIEVLSDPSLTNYGGSEKQRNKLRNFFTKKFEEKFNGLVQKSQDEFKGDLFGWSIYARKKFKTIKEYNDFNWMESFPKAEIDIKADISFGEFGRQPRVPKMYEVKD